MKKNKGMRIYKQRKKRRGSNQILSILGTCAVVFGVGIFGYYVVAMPVYELVKSLDSNSNSESSSTSEISLTDVTDVAESSIYEENSVSTTIVTKPVVTSAVTTTPVTTSVTTKQTTKATTKAEVTTTVTISETESPETEPVVIAKPVNEGGCYYLSASEFKNASTLDSVLNGIEGYDTIVLPLKVTGGELNYYSDIYTAQMAGVCNSSISLDELVSVIREHGLTPAAEISTIADNIYPLTYKKSAYQFDDGYTGEWLDNKAENGGKPWTSPFSELTIEYLSDLVEEISNVGIKNILISDTYFPPFREKDLGYIGEIVQSSDRYKGLTDLVNTLASKASYSGAEAMLYVSAFDVLNSSAEVFKPEEFGNMSVVMNINMNDFSGESISSIMDRLESISGDMNIIPCIAADSVSEYELSSIINNLISLGYDYYMVK